MRQWKLSSLQIEALIFAGDRDRVPYPIYNAVWDAEARRDAVESLLPLVDDDLALACTVLVESQVRILSHGRMGPDLDRELRAYTGIGARDGAAAVVIQEPDPGPGVSGDVVLTLCQPQQVSRLIVDSLPDAPAGRRDPISVWKPDLDLEPEPFEGLVRPLSRREQVERMFNRERWAWGEITICAGPFIDNRPDEGALGFFWMDLAADGRYFVVNGSSVKALPMSRGRFAATIDNYTDAIRERAGDWA